MKTVFKSDEIAHIWANRGAPFGRCASNMSFEGDAFKSYGTVIANRITHNGKTAYVRDCASFSNTTSKHQGHVRNAIHGKEFVVRCGERGQRLSFTPVTLAKYFEGRALRLSLEMPSRYAHKRAEQYQAITGLLESARDVLAYWDMGTARLDKKIAARKAGESQAAETLAGYRAKAIAQESARKAKELKERTARNIKQAEDYLADKIAPLRYFDLNRHGPALDTLPADLRTRFVSAVEAGNARLNDAWRAGESITLPYDVATMLRAEGDEMVTSHGARVPLTDAQRTYRFALVCKAKGWHRNGETHAIGSYQLDAVNEAGVVAGCHRVTWAEIERFANAQGWANTK